MQPIKYVHTLPFAVLWPTVLPSCALLFQLLSSGLIDLFLQCTKILYNRYCSYLLYGDSKVVRWPNCLQGCESSLWMRKQRLWWFSYQVPHLWLWILSAIFSLRMWFNMLIILEWRMKNSHLVSLIPDSLWTSVALWYGLIYPMKFQCILIYCSCASSSLSCHRETDGDI